MCGFSAPGTRVNGTASPPVEIDVPMNSVATGGASKFAWSGGTLRTQLLCESPVITIGFGVRLSTIQSSSCWRSAT